MKAHPDSRADWISSLLRQAWRTPPPPIDLSESQLAAVAPLLIRKGAGALAWRRLRDSPLSGAACAEELHNAYRCHRLQAAAGEERIREVFGCLTRHGVPAVLAKGWAAARYYPEPALRPYGDLDLLVRPGDLGTASEALNAPGAPESTAELHDSFRELPGVPAGDLFQRSETVPLGDTGIRVLGPEDHLALLCLHGLYHGMWRLPWLSDVAVLLESLPHRFDWDLWVTGGRWESRAIRCVIRLAEAVLGCSLDRVPEACREPKLPDWMVPALQKEWASRTSYMQTAAVSELMRGPGALARALWLRWPSPFKATFTTRAPLNNFPRLPFQLAECARRMGRFVRDL